MATSIPFDVAQAVQEIGPATKDEVATHLDASFDAITTAFEAATRGDLIEEHHAHAGVATTIWVVSGTGAHALASAGY
jgi:hypothetical protein